jgi:hypothetical protein
LRQGNYTPPARHELASSERLNTWYYADAPAAVRPRLEAARRITSGPCVAECPGGSIEIQPVQT